MIVESIQSLLQAMKHPESDTQDLIDNVSDITMRVSNLIDVARQTLESPYASEYKQNGTIILFDLEGVIYNNNYRLILIW